MTKPSRARLAVYVAAPCIALAAFLVARGSRRVPEPAAASSAFAPASPSTPPASSAVDPALVRAVADEVDRRNRETRNERDAFQNAGWTFVETAPPDPAIVDLDPAKLDGHEAELRAQLVSTTAPPEQAPRVLAIAERARDVATRVAAAEALGRMGSNGQEALMQLLSHGKLDAGDAARAVAAQTILPPIGDPALTHDLDELVRSPALTTDERTQLTLTLAIARRTPGATR